MDRSRVLDLYDDGYAAAYDERFLLARWPKLGADFEAEVLRGLLDGDDARWLDAGCGTGYFLSLFPGVERAGMDLSPAMLARARAANPDAVFFHEGDFRDDVEEWRGAWSVVSCMWTAYNYVQSMPEFDALLDNFVRWTRPGGSVFIPVMDLEDLRYVEVGYEEDPDVWGGTIALTGVTWTWDEPGTGKRHEHLIAPQIGHVVSQLSPFFTRIEVVRYPVVEPGWISRKAVVATGRRGPDDQGEAEVVWHPRQRHPDDLAREEAEAESAAAMQAAAEVEARRADEARAREVQREAALAHAEHERDHLRSEVARLTRRFEGARPLLPDGRTDLSGTSTKQLLGGTVRRLNPARAGIARRIRRALRR